MNCELSPQSHVTNYFQNQFCTMTHSRRDKMRKLINNINKYWVWCFYSFSSDQILRHSVDNRAYSRAVIYGVHMYEIRRKEILFFCEKTKERDKRAMERKGSKSTAAAARDRKFRRPTCLSRLKTFIHSVCTLV